VELTSLAIDAVKLIRPRRLSDARGYFVETWNRRTFLEAGIDVDFAQDNASFSSSAPTIRGLHFQSPPFAQAKLVRVARGAIFDVAVDLRRESATFGRHVGIELTHEGGELLFVPVGFAHGFCTLEPDTEVAYKISSLYSPAHDHGIAWNDPALGIDWPLKGREPILSQRDRTLPRLSELRSPF
jgi:dTDP-4-dehydrorhamnose 3,5-epimerase